jgi:hypothetical protein
LTMNVLLLRWDTKPDKRIRGTFLTPATKHAQRVPMPMGGNINADRLTLQDVLMAAAPLVPDLNRLFNATLAFGADWRRPVGELAAEHFPDASQSDLDALTRAVEDCRSAIEAHVEATHIRLAGRWTRAEKQQADAWIADEYSWMTRKNRRRAISQGQYYAWHDNG